VNPPERTPGAAERAAGPAAAPRPRPGAAQRRGLAESPSARAGPSRGCWEAGGVARRVGTAQRGGLQSPRRPWHPACWVPSFPLPLPRQTGSRLSARGEGASLASPRQKSPRSPPRNAGRPTDRGDRPPPPQAGRGPRRLPHRSTRSREEAGRGGGPGTEPSPPAFSPVPAAVRTPPASRASQPALIALQKRLRRRTPRSRGLRARTGTAGPSSSSSSGGGIGEQRVPPLAYPEAGPAARFPLRGPRPKPQRPPQNPCASHTAANAAVPRRCHFPGVPPPASSRPRCRAGKSAGEGGRAGRGTGSTAAAGLGGVKDGAWEKQRSEAGTNEAAIFETKQKSECQSGGWGGR